MLLRGLLIETDGVIVEPEVYPGGALKIGSVDDEGVGKIEGRTEPKGGGAIVDVVWAGEAKIGVEEVCALIECTGRDGLLTPIPFTDRVVPV